MTIKLSFISLSVLLLSACSTPANLIDTANVKAVGDVIWQLQEDISPSSLIEEPIPQGATSLFFLRPNDNDPEQASANIAVNDRFQVSLQPGSYTQVYSCAGINDISAIATGLKVNDLLFNSARFDLAPNNNYFFYVDVDNEGNSTVQDIASERVLDYLEDKKYQTHQISRVVPNCPAKPPAPVVIEPIVVIQEPVPAPVLEEIVTIELEVLFDNDKAIIKPAYYHKIQELADFMKLYINTTTTIEGHTDSNASNEYNQKLSERRANAVKSMLVNQFGISSDRLNAIGYGEQRPRATNATAEGRQLNRRVMAVIQERVIVPANQ